MITYNDIVTASGKYKDRLTSPELTNEVKSNIDKLLKQVNGFLQELGIIEVKVSSGFRPSSVNSTIKGAAKKSQHLLGLAVDLVDLTGDLEKKVSSRDDLLKKYGLWQESPLSTQGWVHLDCKDRGARKLNQFFP